MSAPYKPLRHDEAQSVQKLRGLRLLVIDDSPTIRKLVELSFRSKDVLLEFAPTGSDGIASAMRSTPDVILLDYVLPDMKGTEVCQRLARDERTASIPVIVMSAKDKTIRELFRGHDAAVAFLGKPFTADDIVAHVETAVAARGARSSRQTSTTAAKPPSIPAREGEPLLSREQKEALAKAFYVHLAPALARIPEWTAELGATSPALFFARKLLTPALIDALLEELVVAARGALPPRPARAGSGAARFEGELSGFAVLDVLRMLDPSRTGELSLEHGGDRTLVHVRRGEILLVSCLDPRRYVRGAGELARDVNRAPPELFERAEAEQRQTGKPLYVYLAEAGAAVTDDLAALLHRQSKRLLLEATAATDVRFRWIERAALPLYVEAHGRRIPLAQVALERARAELSAQPPAPLDAMIERAPMFSHKVHELELTSSERRLLTVVDGRARVDELARRAELPATEALAVVRRLCDVDVLREKSVPVRAGSARRVMILEPDVEGIQRPLAALLRKRRPEPMSLAVVAPDADLLSEILRESPRMAVINAVAAGREATRVARAVRAEPRLAHVRLVAVLEDPSQSADEDLHAAGFDAVLTKPLLYSDLEQFLTS